MIDASIDAVSIIRVSVKQASPDRGAAIPNAVSIEPLRNATVVKIVVGDTISAVINEVGGTVVVGPAHNRTFKSEESCQWLRCQGTRIGSGTHWD